MSSPWICGLDGSAEISFKVSSNVNKCGQLPRPSNTSEVIIWSMNNINIIWNSRLNRFTVERVMYLSSLQYQIKYVFSESHRKISYDFLTFIIIFSDMNYLRLLLLRIWVISKIAIISNKVNFCHLIHSHRGTTYEQQLFFWSKNNDFPSKVFSKNCTSTGRHASLKAVGWVM